MLKEGTMFKEGLLSSASRKLSRDHGCSYPAVPRISGFEFQATIGTDNREGKTQEKTRRRRIVMKQLTLADLGTISDKAKASWDYLGFGRRPESGTICAQAGWDGWKAWLSESGGISVTMDGLPSDKPFADAAEFVRWLELNAEDLAV